MNIQTLIEQRASNNHFDRHRSLSPAQIELLATLAGRAPSAFHLQNWQFIAVQTAEAKARLAKLAYGQHKVEDAAVTFIICGTLNAHRQLAQTLEPMVAAGQLPATVSQSWQQMATAALEQQAQAQRDEAIRSASLAAMTLMLAAEGMGLASCPMSGFDAEGLSLAFGLAAEVLPVMLLPVGYAAEGNWPQKPRKPLAEILRFA